MSHLRSSSITALFILMLLLASLPLNAAVIHVPAGQPTIQAGIDAAVNGDTVLVAPGTYTGDGNRDMSFHGKAITVRSVYGHESCLIDCEGGRTDAHRAFSFVSGEGPDSILEGFTITGGVMPGVWAPNGPGGAIRIWAASPTIRGCHFHDNSIDGTTPAEGGGAIAIDGSSAPLIDGSTFSFNRAEWYGASGGAILCLDGSPVISNSLIYRSISAAGSGISILDGTPTIVNCTIADNESFYGGAGIWVLSGTTTIVNCILWDNWWYAEQSQLMLGYPGSPATVVIHHSCSHGGEGEVIVGNGSTLFWGAGMIVAHPAFQEGPSGDFYLSHLATGQSEDSPCVDAGDPDGNMVDGTTRTDHGPDIGIVDMGGHYFDSDRGPRLVTGPGPSIDNPPLVHVFHPVQDATVISQITAYGADSWGVNVCCGRIVYPVNDSIITGAGPGEIYGPHVRGFQGDGTPLLDVSFLAYGTNKYGVNVAAGDLDNDGYDEIITGAGPGAVFGPHVRGWNVDGGSPTAMPGVSYFAYGTNKYGVNVAAGDLDGDGYDEIVTGAGPGAVFGPHVRGWNVDGGTATAMPGVSYFAYGTLKYGVNVACGDVDGDGIDELLTAPGPSPTFASHIRGWNVDGGSAVPLPGCSFFAWSPVVPRFGARVASGTHLDDDPRQEIVVGAGPDPLVGSLILVYDYRDGVITQDFSMQAYPSGWTHGVTVATGRFE